MLFGAVAGAAVSAALTRAVTDRVMELHESIADEVDFAHKEALDEVVGMVRDVLEGNYGDPLSADLGNDRHVVFPDRHTAKMVRVLRNRRTVTVRVRAAARAAQFDVPESGPIGERLTLDQVRPGDVVISVQGEGIVIDNNDVLTEGLAIRPLDGFVFTEPDHGVFRLRLKERDDHQPPQEAPSVRAGRMPSRTTEKGLQHDHSREVSP